MSFQFHVEVGKKTIACTHITVIAEHSLELPNNYIDGNAN